MHHAFDLQLATLSYDVDGERVAIGTSSGYPDPGAVEIWVRETEWVSLVRVTAPAPMPADGFGGQVALRGDWMAVLRDPADRCTLNASCARGPVGDLPSTIEIYSKNGTLWEHRSTITETASWPWTFGRMAFDGETLLVPSATNNASAWLSFHREGADWKLTPLVGPPGSEPRYGTAIVAAHRVFLGFPNHCYDHEGPGAIHVLAWNGTAWNVERAIQGRSTARAVGYHLAIDGNDLAIIEEQCWTTALRTAPSSEVAVYEWNSWRERSRLSMPPGVGTVGLLLDGDRTWLDAFASGTGCNYCNQDFVAVLEDERLAAAENAETGELLSAERMGKWAGGLWTEQPKGDGRVLRFWTS